MKVNRVSVTKKLLCIMLPLFTVLFAGIIIFNFLSTNVIMRKSLVEQLKEESNYNVKVIENWRNSILESLESVQGTLETVDFASDEAELKFLEKTLEFSPSIPFGVYEGDADGTYLDGSGWEPDADYVVTERDWYKDGLGANKFTFGAPYEDASTGNFIVSASVLLNRSNRNKMVAAVDIFLDDITEQVAAIRVMDAESGYAFLVDSSTNTILAHNDTSKNAMVISEQDSNPFLATVAGLTSTDHYIIEEIKDEGTLYYVSLNPIEGTSWVLVSCVAENEIFLPLRKIEVVYVVMALLVIAIAGTVIGNVINVTTSPIHTLTEKLITIANGDFTTNVEPKGNDEITTMSEALKDYIHSMCKVIGNILDISSQLDEKARSGNETAKTLNGAATEQARSMRDMKSTMGQLAIAVTDIAENATKLAQVVDTTNMHVSEANDKMQGSVSMAGEGFKNMQTVQKNMQDIVASMKELASVVDSVGESTEEVNGIIQMIGEIASETNLLALNASIEAARAGEAGKGFAVVADEIGKLADSSSQSVQKITDIIQKISEQVGVMVEKTMGNVKIIENNSELISTAYDGFHTIYTDIENTSEIMSSIMEEVDQVNDVASNMAAISQEQSASAELISDTIESLSTQSEHVAEESSQVEKTAEVLSDAAQTLNEHMQKFKIQ